MEWISLVISGLAIILSIISFLISVNENKRKYVFDQLIQIKNDVLDNGENISGNDVLTYLQNQLSSLNENNIKEISNNVEQFCLKISKYYRNIILSLSMMKDTINNAEYKRVCSINHKFLNEIFLLFVQETNINEIVCKYQSLLNDYAKQEIFNTDTLKIKVIVEVNNYLNDIIKMQISTKEALRLLQNFDVKKLDC